MGVVICKKARPEPESIFSNPGRTESGFKIRTGSAWFGFYISIVGMGRFRVLIFLHRVGLASNSSSRTGLEFKFLIGFGLASKKPQPANLYFQPGLSQVSELSILAGLKFGASGRVSEKAQVAHLYARTRRR